MLSGSPDKFLVAVSADALDVFELSISLFDPFLLGFISLSFGLVFTTRRLHRLRIWSKHLESKSFLGRIRLSPDWNCQSTDDRNVIVSIGAEIRKLFEKIFPVLVDLRCVLYEMTKSRRPLPHESRVESLVFDLVDSRVGETVDEMSDAADVRQDLLRRENCARDGTERDLRDGIEDSLSSVLSNGSTQLIEPFGFPVLDFLPVGVAVLGIFEIQILEFLREFENHALALLEIDLESTLDGVGDGVENSSRAVKFFVGCDDLKSLIAILDDFLRRQGVVTGDIERLDDARGYDCRDRVGAVHVSE